MDPVEIQTNIVLSRIAAGAIPFGRAVERASDDGKISVRGGAYTLEDGSGAWTPEANVTRTNPTGAFSTNMVKLACGAGFTTGIIASLDISAMDMSGYEAIGILIKCDKNRAAGDDILAVAEATGLASARVDMDMPALVAGEWTYVSLPFTGLATARDAVLSYGLVAVTSAVSTVFDVQFIGLGATTYGTAGFAKDDQAKEGDEAEENDTVTVLAAGHMNVPLAAGVTCVAEQPLYVVPGTGKLTTTEIASNDRPITATEDQSTAGGMVGVRL